MELIVAEKEGKGYYLQHQEEEKIKMPSDEEKNVTHRFLVYFGLCGSCFYRITNGYLS